MKISFLICGILIALAVLAQTNPRIEKPKTPQQYSAPDGLMRVSVVPVGREPMRAEYESRVEFYSADSKLVCALDYSSEDSDHGYGVVKGGWTPDSQYFVFSLTSSGGHQAWHAPTEFYSRKNGTVRSLNDYFEAGISKSDFRLVSPNTVKTEVWEDKNIPVSVKLDNPPKTRFSRRNKPLAAQCMAGAVIKIEYP
jgi:hypothetical protein